MSNETIALIVGFGIGAFTVAIFTTIIIVLLLKRRPINCDFNNAAVYGPYNPKQIKKLLAKYCTADTIATKNILEQHHKLEPEECKIIRPRRLCSSGYEINTFSKTLGEDLAKYLFGIETLYESSPKTTESIIEYIDTVKRFVRSKQFTSLATPEKQYVATRIEEQLCMIIFKYIINASNRLYEGDEAIILEAIGLEHLLMPTDM